MALCCDALARFFIVALLFAGPASGISCYQCTGTNSTHPFQCNEFLGDHDMVPDPCDNLYGARFCVKHVGRFEGGIGTKRFCSSKDLGNYCDYVRQPGDTLEYRSCIYTCTGDGCNAGVTLAASLLPPLAALATRLLQL